MTKTQVIDATLELKGARNAPYLSQWFGLWAISETALTGLMNVLKRADLVTHLRSEEKRRKAKASRLAAAADPADDDEEQDPADCASPEDGEPGMPAPMKDDEEDDEEDDAEKMARGFSRSVLASSKTEIEYFGDVMVERIDGGSLAIVHLSGVMMKQSSSLSLGTSTVEARRAINALAADGDVKGILLHIDSPGGTVAGTLELAQAVARASAAKPVHVFVSDCCCSAAYWVASQASRISVNETGVVGSIGVYGVVEDSSGAYADANVKVHLIKAGHHKGVGTPGVPISEDQIDRLQVHIDAIYSTFTKTVGAGRKLEGKKLATVADGQGFTSSEAMANGLVDAIGTVEDAAAGLRAEITKPAKAPRQRAAKASRTAAAPAAAADPAAATLDELKANCIGAGADFLLKAIEAKWTVQKAMREWMGQLAQGSRAERRLLQRVQTAGGDASGLTVAEQAAERLNEFKKTMSAAHAVAKLRREFPTLAAALGD